LSAPTNLRRHPSVAAVHEPWLDPRLDEGIRLFNEGHHWHAHEAWEPLWMGLAGEDKMFAQGLIMAAAMLHQYGRGIARGVLNHHANVLQRLGERDRWGIDVAGLKAQLAPYARDAGRGEFERRPGTVQIRRLPA
jgi:uncharacterized protein